MMAREITTTVYTLEELKALVAEGKAKQAAVDRARDWLRDGLSSFQWWDMTLEQFNADLAKIGFVDAEVSFSLGYMQNDGASFTCNSVDVEKLCDFMTVAPGPEVDMFKSFAALGGKYDKRKADRFKRCGFGVSVGDDRAEVETWYNSNRNLPLVEWLAGDFQGAVNDLRRDLGSAMYDILRQEDMWQNEDEQLDETAEANDYTFTIDGKRFG